MFLIEPERFVRDAGIFHAKADQGHPRGAKTAGVSFHRRMGFDAWLPIRVPAFLDGLGPPWREEFPFSERLAADSFRTRPSRGTGCRAGRAGGNRAPSNDGQNRFRASTNRAIGPATHRTQTRGRRKTRQIGRLVPTLTKSAFRTGHLFAGKDPGALPFMRRGGFQGRYTTLSPPRECESSRWLITAPPG